MTLKTELIKKELSFFTRRKDQSQMSEHWWKNLALITAEAIVELQDSINTSEKRSTE